MNLKMSSLLLLMCGALPFGFSQSFTYTQGSVKSAIFEALRPKEAPKNISAECGAVVTEAYGVLQKTYKRGEVSDGSSCSWILRAPANHVVNIISVGFDLENKTKEQREPDDYSGAKILLHDKSPDNPNTLSEFTANEYQHVSSVFVASTSQKEELEVELVYHDNLVYATQTLYIKYEFLNADDMRKLLSQS